MIKGTPVKMPRIRKNAISLSKDVAKKLKAAAKKEHLYNPAQ